MIVPNFLIILIFKDLRIPDIDDKFRVNGYRILFSLGKKKEKEERKGKGVKRGNKDMKREEKGE